jgi:hypothetical protein
MKNHFLLPVPRHHVTPSTSFPYYLLIIMPGRELLASISVKDGEDPLLFVIFAMVSLLLGIAVRVLCSEAHIPFPVPLVLSGMGLAALYQNAYMVSDTKE